MRERDGREQVRGRRGAREVREGDRRGGGLLVVDRGGRRKAATQRRRVGAAREARRGRAGRVARRVGQLRHSELAVLLVDVVARRRRVQPASDAGRVLRRGRVRARGGEGSRRGGEGRREGREAEGVGARVRRVGAAERARADGCSASVTSESVQSHLVGAGVRAGRREKVRTLDRLVEPVALARLGRSSHRALRVRERRLVGHGGRVEYCASAARRGRGRRQHACTGARG